MLEFDRLQFPTPPLCYYEDDSVLQVAAAAPIDGTDVVHMDVGAAAALLPAAIGPVLVDEGPEDADESDVETVPKAQDFWLGIFS